jgi:hypothetical protein
MEPAEVTSPAAGNVPSLDKARKRALLEEYDAAGYQGRKALFDREQITIRTISQWRVETGADRPTSAAKSTGRVKKAAKRPAAATPRAATKRAPAKASQPATPPAPEAAASQDPPRDSIADRPAPTPRFEPDGAADHLKALIHHAEALGRVLADDTGEASTLGVDPALIQRMVSATREAARCADVVLGEAQRHRSPSASSGEDRGRRPWWGGDEPAAPTPAPTLRAPHKWGQAARD